MLDLGFSNLPRKFLLIIADTELEKTGFFDFRSDQTQSSSQVL
jgi:hypothetical protein